MNAVGVGGPSPAAAFAGSNVSGGTEGAQLPPGSAEMIAMLRQIQADMHAMQDEQQRLVESVETQLAEQRQYIEERDSWLEQRLSALERRCDKVQQSSEKVLSCVQGVDFTEIMNLPDRLEFLMPQRGKSSQGFSNQRQSFGNQGMEANDEGGNGQSSNGSLPPAFAKKLRGQLEEIGGQVQQLVNHAEETAEQRKLLWKIDLGIRQMRQHGSSSPARMATAASSRKGSAGGSDLSSSRQGSKQKLLAARRASNDSSASTKAGQPMGRLPEVPRGGGGGAGEVASPGSQRVATPPDYQSPPRPTDISADRG